MVGVGIETDFMDDAIFDTLTDISQIPDKDQIGSLIAGNGNIAGLIIAFALLAAFIWLLFRPYKEATVLKEKVKV